MVGDTRDKRTRSLQQAVRLAGGEKPLAKAMGINRATLNKLMNYSDRKTNCKKLILVEKHTGVRLESLSNDDELNEYLRERNNKLILRSIFKENIVINERSVLIPDVEIGRPIIIGSDGVLISGLASFKIQQASKASHILAAVLDLEALWSELYSIEHIKLLHTERLAIALRFDELLKELLGDRQGQRSDLGKFKQNRKKNIASLSQLRLSCDEVMGRKDEKIARAAGFKSKDALHRIKQVCFQGIPELIKALNDNQVSISAAFEMAKLPKEQQIERLHSKRMNRKAYQLD